MPSPKSLQKFAEKTAVKAGKLLLKEQSKFSIVEYKDKQDIATTADIKSEKLIISEIERFFPKHNIFSEEIGLINNNSKYTWILDPIDQTKEYARGLPEYSVLLSCETETESLSSCFYSPRTNELFSASKGAGASENHKKITVSTQSKLSHSFIGTHTPSITFKESNFVKGWKSALKVAKSAYRLRPTSFNARSLCWLAKGALDGYFIFDTFKKNWWDITSGLLIAKEAGAKITDMDGRPLTYQGIKSGIVATNGKIHDQLLKVINA